MQYDQSSNRVNFEIRANIDVSDHFILYSLLWYGMVKLLFIIGIKQRYSNFQLYIAAPKGVKEVGEGNRIKKPKTKINGAHELRPKDIYRIHELHPDV